MCMRRYLCTVFVFISIPLVFDICLAKDGLDLDKESTRLSYSVGYQVVGDLKGHDVEVNPEMIVKGMKDAIEGNTPIMSEDEMRETLVDLQKKIYAARKEKLMKQADKNLKEGKDFLEENSKKEGVNTLPSGLQYKIINKGSGKTPKANDTVTVHYRGTLINGTEFDSSYKRGKPATFRVNRVIKGWQEALQLMKEGAKWRLFIPPELAYGNRKVGKIPPNSVLIFDVELLSVKESK